MRIIFAKIAYFWLKSVFLYNKFIDWGLRKRYIPEYEIGS